ncbi:MAG: cadherin repeat domain-containing protein [Nitrospirota bacterium]
MVISCSSEAPKGTGTINAPASTGAYSLKIIPADATKASMLRLMPEGFKASDAKIEWLVNGSTVSAPEPEQFKASETNKGSKVQAKASIGGKELFSNTIEIKNAPPEIAKVEFLPNPAKPKTKISVEASAKDIDGDGITILYEWTKNGEPAGNGRELGSKVKKRDRISVKITPFDGEAYGQPVVLNREIGNVPPQIIDDRSFSFNGNDFTYQVKATDPDDGDVLSYSLKSSPHGMTIDANTGLVQWKVPLEFKGKAAFIVSVTDSKGGVSSYSLTFNIKTEK